MLQELLLIGGKDMQRNEFKKSSKCLDFKYLK